MNGEYTHLNDTLRSISELKKSGLTSDELIAVLDVNDVVLDGAEPKLAEIFAARISKTTGDQLVPIVEKLRKQNDQPPIPTITPLSRIISDSLEHALDEAVISGKTTSITLWKNNWLKKNDKTNLFSNLVTVRPTTLTQFRLLPISGTHARSRTIRF